jgi:hypothetical protein
MPRLTNAQVRDAVNERRHFMNNNQTLYSASNWRDDGDLYIVYSYGTHYPVYVYDNIARQWFGNNDKSSPTTERHKTQARPDGDIRWASTDYLRAMILAGSYVNHTAQRVMREVAA